MDPHRLDIRRFAQERAQLSGREALVELDRLHAEASQEAASSSPRVEWRANGETRASTGSAPSAWLHLDAQVRLPMTCQRCLQPVEIDLRSDRWFRFVDDESIAAAEDEEAEEDVLALSREFDLLGLVEDELLMEIPVAPMHETCPEPVHLASSDADFKEALEERKNPFEALQALRGRDPG